MSERSFNFPVSTLIRSAQLMLGALLETIGAPVAARLPAGFADRFSKTITLVSEGATGQKSVGGRTGQLTQEQNAALAEVKRLTSAARDTAKLAFEGNEVLLRQSFRVGNSDPVGLAAIVERAVTVQAACVQYAGPLSEHGWIADDTTVFAAAIEALEGADDVQEAAKGDKKASTVAKNTLANQLYALCQTVQNAAGMAFPEHKADTDAAIATARSRFLMDSFPPAPGTSVEDEESAPAGTPASTAKTN